MALLSTFAMANSTVNNAVDMTSQQGSNCLNSPECYARTHHLPSQACQNIIEKKAHFPIDWRLEEKIPTFTTFYWYDIHTKLVQMFGQQATTANSVGMHIPVSYFCIFDANTGNIIAASFD